MNKKYFSVSIFLLAISSFFLNSCKHDVDLAGIPDISFSNDVQLILSGNCSMSGCHNTDATSEFSLNTYSAVINNGEVKPGDARKSKLYKVLIDNGEKRMPPTGALSDIQIKKVYLWIEQGAKNN